MYTDSESNVRSSAGAIAGMFANFPNLPTKKSPINQYAIDTIFALGHIREHTAIHYLNTCDGITQMKGQNGFARTSEYLKRDMLTFYNERKWLLPGTRDVFNKTFMKSLEEKVLNTTGSKMAIKVQSMLFLKEQQVGNAFLHDVATLLRVSAFQDEEAFTQMILLPAMEFAKKHFFEVISTNHPLWPSQQQEMGYVIQDIPYSLPRFTATFGTVQVKCQPDGFCLVNNIRSVVEIKSPVHGHYTSNATLTKEVENRRALWAKYFVQIAIEMTVTDVPQALFVTWFEDTAQWIQLGDVMGPLIQHVGQFVAELGLAYKQQYDPTVSVNSDTAIRNAFKVVFNDSNKDIKSMKVGEIRGELALDGIDNTGNRSKISKELVLHRRKKQLQNPNSMFDIINCDIQNILNHLTGGSNALCEPVNTTNEAWRPLEKSTFN